MKHSEIPARNAAIVAALRNGASLETLATRHSLSTSTIGKIATDAGVSAQPKTLGLYAVRDTEIVRRAENGEDFTSIGKSFDLTRERVRQIVARDLGKSGLDLAAERRAVRVEAREQRALTYAAENPSATCAEVAERSGLRVNDVEVLLGPGEAARRRPVRALTCATPTDDMLASLRRVAALPGGQPLAGPFYDTHRGPGAVSSVRLIQVFDTWTGACAAAGVVSMAAPRDTYVRRWDRQECLSYVVGYLTVCPGRPAFSRFRAWIREQEDAPSAETVRLRCGKWIDTVRDAYTLIERESANALGA